MNRLILWLSKRRRVAALIAAIYFVPSVLCHDWIEKFAVTLEKKLSLAVFNAIMTAGGLAASLILSTLILTAIKSSSHRYLTTTYWCLTMGLAILSYNTLIVKNIEIVHYPQYALLALPVFALTLRAGETVLWVTLLGAVDEAYQYLVLHRARPTIYDFNDIILNLIGGAVGVVFLVTCFDRNSASNSRSSYSVGKLIESAGFRIIGGLLFSGLLLYLAGLLRPYPEQKTSGALIFLGRGAPPAGFWRAPGPPYKTFHILHPAEGAVLIIAILAVYVYMDYRIEFIGSRAPIKR
jgi:hypothetical protein